MNDAQALLTGSVEVDVGWKRALRRADYRPLSTCHVTLSLLHVDLYVVCVLPQTVTLQHNRHTCCTDSCRSNGRKQWLKDCCVVYLQHSPVRKQTDQQHEVVDSVILFLLNADDSRWPETRLAFNLVVPRKETELEQVLDDHHRLRVGYHCDPVRLGWARNAEHGPEEDGERVDDGEDAGVDHVIEDHEEVAEELGAGHECVEEGDEELEEARHVRVEILLRFLHLLHTLLETLALRHLDVQLNLSRPEMS